MSANENSEWPVGLDEGVFIAADEPVLYYPSTAIAEQSLEAIDVDNGVYPAAYGPAGEPFHVGTYDDCVVITPTGEPNRPDELKALLVRYFESAEVPAKPNETLALLVVRFRAEDDAFWADRDPYGDRFGAAIPRWGCLAFGFVVTAVGYAVFG